MTSSWNLRDRRTHRHNEQENKMKPNTHRTNTRKEHGTQERNKGGTENDRKTWFQFVKNKEVDHVRSNLHSVVNIPSQVHNFSFNLTNCKPVVKDFTPMQIYTLMRRCSIPSSRICRTPVVCFKIFVCCIHLQRHWNYVKQMKPEFLNETTS
jgi:hypothetical protein